MLNRAYSFLSIKGIDEERRVIRGIASTITPDRQGDVMVPSGAKFDLPIPLLWQHKHDQPIGHVTKATVTGTGIEIEAQIARVDEPGGVKSRIDDAWQNLKHGLVRGLSIGWQPNGAPEFIKGGFAKYTDWSWLELSAVTVGANAEATILSLKSADAPHLAATGDRGRSSHPGATGSRKSTTMKTISERLHAAKSALQEKQARLDALMTKADGDGLEQEEREERNTITDELEELAAQVKSLTALEVAQAQKATPVVVKAQTARGGSDARDGEKHDVHLGQYNTPPGIGFARAVICKAASMLSAGSVSALEFAKARYPSDDRVQTYLKAAVAGGTTTDSTWAGPLVDATNLASEFIEYLRPMTIIGQFGSGNIPSLRRVPFNVRVVGQDTGATGYWVGQGVQKPLTKFDTSATTLLWAKAATIAVITDELARFSSPSAEEMVRRELTNAIVALLDTTFIDPDVAAVANVSPGAITNGITGLVPSGTDAAAIRADLNSLIAPFLASNQDPTGMVLIMPNTVALAISLLVNALGQPEFPSLGIRGGTLQGIPVITSQYAATSTGASPNYGGNIVALVNAPEIFIADDGGVTVDASREASLEMSDDPVNDSGTVVSMFQTNQIALRAERYINWSRRRTAAVQYLHSVEWGGVASPGA